VAQQLVFGDLCRFAAVRALGIEMVQILLNHHIQRSVDGFFAQGKWFVALLAAYLHKF
jgi:hypothetical protein